MRKIKRRYKKAKYPWLKVIGDTAIVAIPVLEWFISNPEWEAYKRAIQIVLLLLKLYEAFKNRNKPNSGMPKYDNPPPPPASNNTNYSAILLVLLLSFTSCKITERSCREKYPCPEITTTAETHDTIERIRDSVVTIPPDSSWLKAKLVCDSLGNIYLQEIDCLKNGVPKITAIIKNNQLTVNCKVDSQLVYLRWKETHIRESKQETKTIIKKINVLTDWQIIQIWSGRAGIVLFAGLLVFAIYKLKKA